MTYNNLPSTSNVQTNLPLSSLSSPDKIAHAIVSFGNDYREKVFCKYQQSLPIHRAVMSDSPSFHKVTNAFSKDATRFWLRFHIAEAFAFVGIYDTASKYQIQQTADLILDHEIFGQLTLDEFLNFLMRFKRGDYGKIYQSSRPNPQEFLSCLRPFWTELSAFRHKREESLRQKRLSEALRHPDNMTRQEWIELKIITAMYNSDYTVTKNDFEYLELCQKNNTPNNAPSLLTSFGS